MAFGTRVGFETLRSLAFGSISGSYAALGVPLAHHCRLLHITNNTNADMLVSFDGVHDHEIVPSQSFVLYDFTSDQVQEDGFFLSVGTQIYARQASGAPSSGSIYAAVVAAFAGGV